MALCPFADKRWLIPPGANDPRIEARVAVLHSDGGNMFNLGDYFDGPSGGIESHFHIAKNGHLFQYRDTDFEADANYLANPFALSIETQGTGYEPWTEAQIKTMIRLLFWIHREHPKVLMRRIDRWDGSGVGYHIQFGSPGKWTNVGKICPGPIRIRQYNTRIIPTLESGGGDEFDMADLEDLRRIVREEVRYNVGFSDIRVDLQQKGGKDDVVWTLNDVLRRLLNDEWHLKKYLANRIDTVADEVVSKLPQLEPGENTNITLSQDQIREAVKDAMLELLGSIEDTEETSA